MKVDVILRPWPYRTPVLAGEIGKQNERYIIYGGSKSKRQHKPCPGIYMDTITLLRDQCVGSSHRDRAGPETPPRAPHLRARGSVPIWTIPVRSGWSWTECSPYTGLWTGTPAPSRSTSGQTHPGPLQQTQRTAAGHPCPPSRGLGGACGVGSGSESVRNLFGIQLSLCVLALSRRN